jgi:hypothetical protein
LVVNKADRKKTDSDVLRAADIIPTLGEQDRRKQSYREPQVASDDNSSVEPNPAADEPDEIPKFDLNEGLMAEQRTVSAARRKAPGRKTETVDYSPVPVVEDKYAPIPQPFEQQLIIAAIVARDIEKFCRGRVAFLAE